MLADSQHVSMNHFSMSRNTWASQRHRQIHAELTRIDDGWLRHGAPAAHEGRELKYTPETSHPLEQESNMALAAFSLHATENVNGSKHGVGTRPRRV